MTISPVRLAPGPALAPESSVSPVRTCTASPSERALPPRGDGAGFVPLSMAASNPVMPLEQATEGLTVLASRATRAKIVIKITD
jgi:hypothetical protein